MVSQVLELKFEFKNIPTEGNIIFSNKTKDYSFVG
jgi:hypothetical protein